MSTDSYTTWIEDFVPKYIEENYQTIENYENGFDGNAIQQAILDTAQPYTIRRKDGSTMHVTRTWAQNKAKAGLDKLWNDSTARETFNTKASQTVESFLSNPKKVIESSANYWTKLRTIAPSQSQATEWEDKWIVQKSAQKLPAGQFTDMPEELQNKYISQRTKLGIAVKNEFKQFPENTLYNILKDESPENLLFRKGVSAKTKQPVYTKSLSVFAEDYSLDLETAQRLNEEKNLGLY